VFFLLITMQTSKNGISGIPLSRRHSLPTQPTAERWFIKELILK
jgi:hypothetical protein